MDWVHGHSRVTSGASRLHHLAGVTQVAPGGPTNEWQGLRAQQPPTGLLASKWVIQFPFRDKSHHREQPRHNDGTRRLCDLGGGTP